MSFKTYLEDLGYQASTVHRYEFWERSFLAYIQGQSLESLTKLDLLEYLNSGKVSRSTMQLRLGRLRRYYHYLELPDPLAYFKLPRSANTKEVAMLSGEEIRQLVRLYSTSPKASLESKVGISLLAHQGLSVEELPLLRAQDIDLLEGIIHSPQGSRLAPRSLKLEASQVLHLSQLLQDKRPKDKLLTYQGGQHAVNRHQRWKQQVIKSLEEAESPIPFVHLGQLRSSRIVRWLESEKLLRAQYLSGHHHASSTQSCQPLQSEGLRESLKQYHPFFKED